MDANREAAPKSDDPAVGRAKRVQDLFDVTEKLDFGVGQKIGLVLSGVFFLAAIASGVAIAVTHDGQLWPVVIVGALLFLFGLALALAIYFTSVDDRNARRAFWQQAEIEATLSSGKERPGVRELLQLNRQEMSTYHLLTRVQARRSFSNSLVAMWLGFLIVVGCVVVIAIPDVIPAGGRLTVAAIGTIGTVASGFVTRTFLKQHSMSIDQLNRFFNQPLISSYLLTAERVALELHSEKARAAALTDVIDRALEITSAERAAVQPPSRGGMDKLSLPPQLSTVPRRKGRRTS